MLLGVIADDLTGANDTGVQFIKKSLRTQVVLDLKATPPEKLAADVMVWSTDSRALAAAEAKTRAMAAARLVKSLNARYVYKKIDSTLRGNVGAEIDGILEQLEIPFAVIAPAFPQNGRTTVDGVHMLFGTPVAETEIARDPRMPVRESCLPKLLVQQSCYSAAHISRTVISAGIGAVRDAVRRHVARGVRLISFDAARDEDLVTLAEGARAVNEALLWVGSAALAEVLPDLYGWKRTDLTEIPAIKPGTVLVVVGSVSSVTGRQLERFIAVTKSRAVVVEPEALILAGQKGWKEYLAQAQEAIKQGYNLVLTTRRSPEAVALARKTGALKGFAPGEVSDVIARSLGRMVKELNCANVAGLFLTGGDTAVAVCRELGAAGIEILAEVAPGIPMGSLTGGDCSGLRVVTKAGAFGDDDAIVTSVQALTGKK